MISTNRSDRETTTSRRAFVVPVATVGVNLISYLLLLCAARVLEKSAYGELVALLGVLLVGTVPALAVQTVAARRIATRSDITDLTRATTIVAGIAVVLLVLVTPLLEGFLRLGSWSGPLAVAAALPATTLLGTYQGIAQGSRRFGRLAGLIALTTGGRSAGGLAGVFIGRTPLWCLLGVAAGTSLAAIAGRAWTGGTTSELSPDGRPSVPGTGTLGHLLTEIAHAAHAHGAFLVLTSLDVLLARHVLSADNAGVYAAGSVITRATLWLPQSVATIMFATLTDHARHRRTLGVAISAVAGVGVVTVLGSALFGRLLVSIVGGAGYHELDRFAWMFAALGALLALIQLAIMAGLALRRRGRIALVWLVAATDLCVVLLVSPTTPRDTVDLLASIAVLGAGCAAALAAGPRTISRSAPANL